MNLLSIFNKVLSGDSIVKTLKEILSCEFVQAEPLKDTTNQFERVYRSKNEISFEVGKDSVIDYYEQSYNKLTNLGFGYIGMDWDSMYFYVGYKVI